MKTILQLNSSLFGEGGSSSGLASAFISRYRAGNPGARLVVRDLAKDGVPHLTAEGFAAFGAKPEARTPEGQTAVELSDTLIRELREADVLVIGLPMYNFGVPSMLKAYFDHVARARETFRYTENGPEGLLKGEKAYVFAARGGVYLGTTNDTEIAWLRQMLGFLGITDVEVVYAEGLAMEASRGGALEAATREIEHLTEGVRA